MSNSKNNKGKESQIREFIEMAFDNIVKHGDTDIFPFPIENHIFHDKRDEICSIVEKMDCLPIGEVISLNSPININSLVTVGYSGFRWATQIDPIWNLYLLSLVLKVGDKIESKRLSIE